jgi:hypothetical protein
VAESTGLDKSMPVISTPSTSLTGCTFNAISVSL